MRVTAWLESVSGGCCAFSFRCSGSLFVVAGFGLAYAASLITGGRLGDLFGRRRMYATGLTLFTLASLACGLAPAAGFLIGARVLQDLSAALLTPQVLAIINVVYTGQHRMPGPRDEGERPGEARPPRHGAGHAQPGRGRAAARAGPAARLAGVDVALPRRGPAPARRVRRAPAPGRRPAGGLSLFSQRAFSAGLLTGLVYSLAMASFFLVLALYLQQGHGLSTLGSGLIFLPLGIGYFAASTRAGAVAAKLGRQVLAVGSLAVAAGYLLPAATVAQIGTAGSVLWLVPGLLLSGAGMGLVMAPLPRS